MDGYEIAGGGIIKEAIAGEGAARRNRNAITAGERVRFMGQEPLLVLCAGDDYAHMLERALFDEDRKPYFAGNIDTKTAEALLAAGLVVLVTEDVDLPAYETCGDIEKDITEILIRTKAELRHTN